MHLFLELRKLLDLRPNREDYALRSKESFLKGFRLVNKPERACTVLKITLIDTHTLHIGNTRLGGKIKNK